MGEIKLEIYCLTERHICTAPEACDRTEECLSVSLLSRRRFVQSAPPTAEENLAFRDSLSDILYRRVWGIETGICDVSIEKRLDELVKEFIPAP